MQIARATLADSPQIAAFVGALLSELSGEPCEAPLDEVTAATLRLPTVTGFLARRDGRPVGLLMLNDCAAIYAGGRFGEITELYVPPADRSSGIAARLVARAVEHARAEGWQRLEVGAPAQPAWSRTLDFYRREGFEVTGPRLRRLIAARAPSSHS